LRKEERDSGISVCDHSRLIARTSKLRVRPCGGSEISERLYELFGLQRVSTRSIMPHLEHVERKSRITRLARAIRLRLSDDLSREVGANERVEGNLITR